ncbi:MAG TPA: hypothetical protein VMU13_02875 [Candidatus Paceibacterota bacterium]|nr:hypothetical protein [Candidatus Paceibacterota bacterium]
MLQRLIKEIQETTMYRQISVVSAAGIAAAILTVGAVSASALSVNLSGSASSSATGANAAARLSTIISKANTDIAARIHALNALSTRVQGLENVSDTEKASIASQVQTNTTGLTTLQAKIDADTDVATARTDAQMIFGTYRIYALAIPQGWILASADRVMTIAGLMANLGTNIQTRITADQSAGKDVSALAATYADMTAKIGDATVQANTAQSGISSLVPDQGNQTTAASNHTALVAARGDIKTAAADITAARKDITTLLKGLKSLGGGTSASVSGSTSGANSAPTPTVSQ